jgi:hypothetical protein
LTRCPESRRVIPNSKTNNTTEENDMSKVLKALALIALVIGVNLTMAIVTAPSNAESAPTVVHEDEAGWNCYTMGNGSCGDTLTYFESDKGRGAVLPVANDGIVYVSWPDGTVTPATEVQRHAAWETCVDLATGGDASLFACDDDYQNPGDHFTK